MMILPSFLAERDCWQLDIQAGPHIEQAVAQKPVCISPLFKHFQDMDIENSNWHQTALMLFRTFHAKADHNIETSFWEYFGEGSKACSAMPL